MKRILFAGVAAVFFVATGANALTINVDTDKATYNPGETILVTITSNWGGESLPVLAGTGLEIGWNPAVATPNNLGVYNAFGSGTQELTANANYPAAIGGSAVTYTSPGYGGGYPLPGAPANPGCSNNGYSCQFLAQSMGNYSGVADPGQTLVSQLALTANAPGLVGLFQFAYVQTWGKAKAVPNYGANFLNAEIVPEPGTLLLLGAGMAGLMALGRRKS